MRKLPVVLIALVCLMAILCACGGTGNYAEKLVGSWQASDGQHQLYPQGFVFNKDGSFDFFIDRVFGFCIESYYSELPIQKTGSWTVTEDTLELCYSEDTVVRYQIVSVTNDKIELRITFSGITETAEFRRD